MAQFVFLGCSLSICRMASCPLFLSPPPLSASKFHRPRKVRTQNNTHECSADQTRKLTCPIDLRGAPFFGARPKRQEQWVPFIAGCVRSAYNKMQEEERGIYRCSYEKYVVAKKLNNVFSPFFFASSPATFSRKNFSLYPLPPSKKYLRRRRRGPLLLPLKKRPFRLSLPWAPYSPSYSLKMSFPELRGTIFAT